ncbi:MAG: hypothetical protein KME21_15235 [Desmonostoc vinosum HA7617-LM4]|jgi:hypothetical protein|nr:hypothetical protein [Desmonostoc vinosum HA7617-LM4]
MLSQTLFLQPILDPLPNPNPNFAEAEGVASFSNYNQTPSGALTSAQVETLTKDGVAAAVIDAGAIFQADPTFSSLFTNSSGIGLEGPFEGSANNQIKVVASFDVGAKQNFSFNFEADLNLTAKEIENYKTEYNRATSKATFVVLDTTDINKPKVLDYFGIQGNLISSKQIGNFQIGSSRNVTITSSQQTADIDGNNQEDSLTAKATGTYRQKFKRNTNITVIEINTSAVEFQGDTLIGNLGEDVIYGTIWSDRLKGTNRADKIYGSLGNDRLYGYKGDDIQEGGKGDDALYGSRGNDKLYGGWDDDLLNGGRGSDILCGGDGYDKFVFNRQDSLLKGEYDVIRDFQVGIDKIVFQNWGYANSDNWLEKMFAQGRISDTQAGVRFELNCGLNQGVLLLSGITFNQISSESIIF